jgi:hypothetical protein
MGKRHKKNKKYKNSYSTYTPTKFKSKNFVTSKDIKDIAFKVFGSTYYTPTK